MRVQKWRTKAEYISMFVMLIAHTVGTNVAPSDEVDIQLLGQYIDRLMNKSLGVEAVQARIDVLNFTRTKYDGNLLVKQLSGIISEKISQNIDGLRLTKQILEAEIQTGKHKMSSRSKWVSCCKYDESKTAMDKRFKTKIDNSTICELVSPSTPLAYYQLPRAVVNQMIENNKNMPFLKWQYVGSNQGVLFSYPAHRNQDFCRGNQYDPRYRPWYVEAASPEKKRVVILLDSSNSMGRTHNSERLIDVAADAIGTLLDSFMPSDMVGIVAFNDTAFYPSDCFSKQLAYADGMNKKKLKEEFLSKLQPGGQSNYAEAFRAAFDLMASENFTEGFNKRMRCVILFISDGDASEIHHNKLNNIYRIIREGNRNILNYATIFTYGLGRQVNMELLKKLANQDFNDELGKDDITEKEGFTVRNVTQGSAYKIQEPYQLRDRLTFFYTKLIKNDTIERSEEPSFSVPYFDPGGLGLIFTVGFPVVGQDAKRTFIAAVAANDISISDLLGDVIKLKNDDRSYVFVIDGSGRVLIHPLMPVPEKSLNTPYFIHIETLERDEALKCVIKSMKEGLKGEKTILSNRVAPAGDCNKVFIINQTYHWHPIPNTNFSLCFVEEVNDYIVNLSPPQSIFGCFDKKGNSIVAHRCPNMSMSTFRYHRLDLFNTQDVCRHLYKMSTVTSSVVKLSPQCFIQPEEYESNSETIKQVQEYESMFNDFLSASSMEEAYQIYKYYTTPPLTCDSIHVNVISDIIWTSSVDAIWMSEKDNHIVRRFIGTRSGMVRFYPGTNITSSYDPITRIWYELALAYPDMRVFSLPYKDVAGAGNVITISHTVHTPQIPLNDWNAGLTEKKVIGVMGMDLSLTYIYAKLLEFYPMCKMRWHCILMDIRGYLVLHQDYTESGSPERKHITGEDGPLSEILLQRGLMYRARCLELETTKYKVTYVLIENAYVNEMEHRDKCKRYYMEAVPNTNIFFVARESHSSCYYHTCVKFNKPCSQHTECVIHDDWSNTTCECPCRADLTINSCTSFVDAGVDIVACYPFRDRCKVVENDCYADSLPPCYDPKCEKLVSHFNCSSVVGCTWCKKSLSGAYLEKPYCSETDFCYDGFEGQKILGIDINPEVCYTQVELDDKILLTICVSGGMFVIIFVATISGCCYLHRKMNKRKKMLKSNNSNQVYSEVDDDIANIFAAIGGKAGGSVQSNSISIGPRESVQTSASSVGTSARQRSMSSPQVVLSIVDSDGAEIARSLPRPVQIVRGKQFVNKDGGKISSSDNDKEKPHPTNFKPSIRLGEATSGSANPFVDASSNIAEAAIKSKISSENNAAKHSDNEEQTNHIAEKYNKTTQNKEHNNVLSGNATRAKHARKALPSEDRTQQSSLKYVNRMKSITNILLSVLKKKEQPVVSPLDDISSVDDISSMYFNMFEEPKNVECDVPIIQSDHSDEECTENQVQSGAVLDYMSMCSGDSSRVNNDNSWRTASSQELAEVGEDTIDDEPDHVEVLRDNYVDSKVSEEFVSNKVVYIKTISKQDNANSKNLDNACLSAEMKNSTNKYTNAGVNSNKAERNPSYDHSSQLQNKEHTDRIRNRKKRSRNTDNFIVYV
uniref:VWFA and cache domain-containing protein 1-like isoform X1 n=1 Tax=Styela clava TaxID=7725 RepID=UPI00193993F7|nr:VWFA and cache domain-containing protein 1-like isoform X1 [Styela clava]